MEQQRLSISGMNRSDEPDEPSTDLRRQAIEAIERIGELNLDADPDQVLADVTTVVEDVRRERRQSETSRA